MYPFNPALMGFCSMAVKKSSVCSIQENSSEFGMIHGSYWLLLCACGYMCMLGHFEQVEANVICYDIFKANSKRCMYVIHHFHGN